MENNFKPRNEKFIVSFEVEVAHVGVNFEGSQQDFYAKDVRDCEASILDKIAGLIGTENTRSKIVKVKIN